jgi:hypothetical protein
VIIPIKYKYYNNNNKSQNRVRVMVFNATFNNISVISWRSVLLMEETALEINFNIVELKYFLGERH